MRVFAFEKVYIIFWPWRQPSASYLAAISVAHPSAPKMNHPADMVVGEEDENGESFEEAWLSDVNSDVLATIDESINKEEAPIGKCSRESEKYLCTICMASDRKVVFMPCSHFVACKLCSESCGVCPVCRTALMGKLEVFL